MHNIVIQSLLDFFFFLFQIDLTSDSGLSELLKLVGSGTEPVETMLVLSCGPGRWKLGNEVCSSQQNHKFEMQRY